jgi:hypothetical protein
MLALHSLSAHGLDSIRVLMVLFVIFVVAFWKIILQLLIIIAAAIVLMGTVTLFGVLHII